MTSSTVDRPTDIPAEFATALEGSSDRQLRTVIHYAEQLLREHPPLTDTIELREGEELVRMDDHGAYTIVIVERPDETGKARGPFTYRVAWQPDLDGGGKYRWHYLGRVHDAGGA